MEHHHRSALKQQNKSFKGASSSSKRSLKRENKGKVANEKSSGSLSTEHSGKSDRLNSNRQAREAKRIELLKSRRGMGGIAPPPRLIVMLSVTKSANCSCLKSKIIEFNDARSVGDNMNCTETGSITMELGDGNHRITVVESPRDLLAFLDLMMVADVLAITFHISEKVDALGDLLLAAGRNFSMPPAVIAFPVGTEEVPSMKRPQLLKSWQENLQDLTGREVKLTSDRKEDASHMIRFLQNSKLGPRGVSVQRPLLVAEDVILVSSEPADDDGGASVTVAVTGYLRGCALSPNQLIHVPAHGTFQMSRIVMHPDPLAPKRRSRASKGGEVDMAAVEEDSARGREMLPDPAGQEPLDMENQPDDMDAEQTWPSPAELLAAERERRRRKVLAPRGASSYQAAWFVRDDEPEAAALSEEDQGEGADTDGPAKKGTRGGAASAAAHDQSDEKDDEEGSGEEREEEEEDEEEGTEGGMEEEDAGAAPGEAEREFRRRRAEARDNAEFPDEVDTPEGVEARVRFQKYRGLRSLRTSPWDPLENLPRDHARAFHFTNPRASRARAQAPPPPGAAAAPPGAYVTLHLRRVPRAMAARLAARAPSAAAAAGVAAAPLVVGALLLYENKMGLMHYTVGRHRDDGDVIRGKDELVMVCGLRRWAARPIFSEPAAPGGADKHRLLRFLPARGACAASVYAPVTWGPAPVLLLRRHRSGALTLAATGTAAGPDAHRVVLKRAVLTGLPFKVRKRKAVVRFMFSDPGDVRWFRPVELWTKLGRRGHIRESLGTHGYMKCVFDAPVDHSDTVCLSLYKRVFPPFPPAPADQRLTPHPDDDAPPAPAS